MIIMIQISDPSNDASANRHLIRKSALSLSGGVGIFGVFGNREDNMTTSPIPNKTEPASRTLSSFLLFVWRHSFSLIPAFCPTGFFARKRFLMRSATVSVYRPVCYVVTSCIGITVEGVCQSTIVLVAYGERFGEIYQRTRTHCGI